MIFDTTMLNVSIKDIVQDLDTTIKNVQWAITIYALVMASLMLLGGKIGDLYGRKKAFIVGASIYGLGTLLAALSPSITVLIVSWSLIEGIGAALMMPATVSLLLANYSGKDRKIGFGIWGGIAGSTAALGPLFGGYMTTNYSWRWAFALEIILVVAILGLSFLIKESRGNKKESLDIIGTILSTAGLATLIYGIIEASTYGWWKAREIYKIGNLEIDILDLSITPIFIFTGFIILTFFILWQIRISKSGDPLLHLSLFKNKEYTAGIATTGILGLAHAGIFFTLPIFLQVVGGYSAQETGIALFPMSITVFFSSIIFAKFGSKIPAKYIIQFGILIVLGSVFVLKNGLNTEITNWDITPGLALFGLGFGIIMSQITNLTLSAAPIDEAGEASGLSTTIRNLGGSLGTAIIGTILVSSLTTNMVNGINESTLLPDPLKQEVIKDVEENGQKMAQEDENTENSQIPQNISEELKNIKNEATVLANKKALNYTAFFAFLTLLISFLIPTKKLEENPLLAEDKK
ncbi:MAG: MFS transporter [Parcubacteria group bacterium]|nr:MFS transporter [Parcubacteria group bacterium]